MPSHSPPIRTVGADTTPTQEVIDLMNLPSLPTPVASSGAPFDINSLDAGNVAEFKARCADVGINAADAETILVTWATGAITNDPAKQALAAEEAARLLDAAGQSSPGKDEAQFWSGGNEAKAIAKQEGDSLESKGQTGYLFDGMHFGLGWGHSGIGALWDGLSAHLARGCKGVVEAHQYRGVRGQSVFARVELPVLKKALDDDIVEKIVIHRYWKKQGPDGKPIWTTAPGRNPELVKADEFTLESSADADALPIWEYEDEAGIADQTGLEPDGGTIRLPGF